MLHVRSEYANRYNCVVTESTVNKNEFIGPNPDEDAICPPEHVPYGTDENEYNPLSIKQLKFK